MARSRPDVVVFFSWDSIQVLKFETGKLPVIGFDCANFEQPFKPAHRSAPSPAPALPYFDMPARRSAHALVEESFIYHHDQSRAKVHPVCSMNADCECSWPPTPRPSQSTWAVSLPKIGSCHSH